MITKERIVEILVEESKDTRSTEDYAERAAAKIMVELNEYMTAMREWDESAAHWRDY